MNISKNHADYVNITGDLHRINYSIDDFKRLREENFLYIDKTKMIEDLLAYDDGKAVMFTRPRRFGKSLNLSMLRYFFDDLIDSHMLFNGLYIENSELYEKHLNKYPVLYLNFKGITTDRIEDVKETIISIINKELYELYAKYQFEELMSIELKTNTGNVNIQGAKDITRILCKKTGKKVIVLVDEYDSLLNRTYGTHFWKDAARILKEVFGELFKSNEYLQMGVLTGVSRIGKELGFSDMNNLAVYGMSREYYYEYYGLTEHEVKELLYMNKINLTSDFYRMYNGYALNDTPHMFNTVSILKLLDDYNKTGKVNLAPYWINSSANSILKDNIIKMDIEFRNKLLNMLDGSTIIEGIFESIDYELLDKPPHMLSLLIDAGYLCPVKRIGGNLFEIKIPNEEVLYGYQTMIDSIAGTGGEILESLCRCLIKGNLERFEDKFNDILLNVSSFNDFGEKENSYHCLLEGALLFLLGRFKVKSNREAGAGRFDIALIPTDYFKKMYKPVIIEFKTAKEKREKKLYNDDELLLLAEKALDQIEAMRYYAEYDDLYSKDDFMMVGIGTQGKACKVAWR